MLKYVLTKVNSAVLLIALLNMPNSEGASISATGTGQVMGYKTWTSTLDTDTTVIFTVFPESDYSNGLAQGNLQSNNYDCPNLSVQGLRVSGSGFFRSMGACKAVSSSFERHLGNYQFQASLNNNTYSSQKVYSKLLVYGTRYSVLYSSVELFGVVPANSSCTATIQNVAIGNIISGNTTYQRLPVSVSGTSSSRSLIISGSDIQSDGKLNLGGSSSGVQIYPNSRYISGKTWNTGVTSSGSNSIAIDLTVDAKNGKAGTWTSSLLATLTCS